MDCVTKMNEGMLGCALTVKDIWCKKKLRIVKGFGDHKLSDKEAG